LFWQDPTQHQNTKGFKKLLLIGQKVADDDRLQQNYSQWPEEELQFSEKFM
jgi:hypothetical protein